MSARGVTACGTRVRASPSAPACNEGGNQSHAALEAGQAHRHLHAMRDAISPMRHSRPGKPIGTCMQSRSNLDACRGHQKAYSVAIGGNHRHSPCGTGASFWALWSKYGNHRHSPCGTGASYHPRPPSSSPPAPNAAPRNDMQSGPTKPPDERGNQRIRGVGWQSPVHRAL